MHVYRRLNPGASDVCLHEAPQAKSTNPLRLAMSIPTPTKSHNLPSASSNIRYPRVWSQLWDARVQMESKGILPQEVLVIKAAIMISG